jgi:hypothetical protein
MAKGFKDDSGKFRPFSKTGVGASKKEKSVTAGKGKLITEGTFEFTPREGGVTWEKAVERFIEFKDNNEDLEGFTFDPEINQGFDLENDPDQAINFHDLYVQGGDENPVFVVGVTNQLGGTPTRELQSAYEQIKSERRNAFIGFFTDEQNEFTDISFPISDVDREEALEIARDQAQSAIGVVFSDGTFSIESV